MSKPIAWHNIDSIFLLTPNDLLLTAFSGDVYQRWKINSGENSSVRGKTVTDNYLYNDPMNSAPIHYVANRPVLLAALKTQQFPPDHPSYFETPILAALNLDFLSASTLPIFYPDSYRQALYPANKPHFAYRNNSVYYLFPNSATVYRYQIPSNQLDSAGLNSDFTEDKMAPFNGDLYDQSAVRAYLSSQPEFKNLIYDPFKDLFYRFHFGPYPYQIKGNEGKRGYTHLTVFTPDLEQLTEIQLPLTQQYYGATPTPQGLAIYTFNGSEDTNRLTFFNFVCSTSE